MRALALLAALALTGCQSMPDKPDWWPTLPEPHPSHLMMWGHELAHAVHGAWHGQDERAAGAGANGKSFTIQVLESESPMLTCLAMGYRPPEGFRTLGCSFVLPGNAVLVVPKLFQEGE